MKTSNLKTNADLLSVIDEAFAIELIKAATEKCGGRKTCTTCPLYIGNIVIHSIMDCEKRCPCTSQNFNSWYNAPYNADSPEVKKFLGRLRFRKEVE